MPPSRWTTQTRQSLRQPRRSTEIVAYALKRGGTCTGEHGIGSGKTEHLKKEHGDSLPFVRKIKGLADPNGIMNPGKIFSEEERQVPEETL
jgi:D-lactate dehydrogenase (cytochrome)